MDPIIVLTPSQALKQVSQNLGAEIHRQTFWRWRRLSGYGRKDAFDQEDVICLTYFGRYMRQGFNARTARRLTSEAVRQISKG